MAASSCCSRPLQGAAGIESVALVVADTSAFPAAAAAPVTARPAVSLNYLECQHIHELRVQSRVVDGVLTQPSSKEEVQDGRSGAHQQCCKRERQASLWGGHVQHSAGQGLAERVRTRQLELAACMG